MNPSFSASTEAIAEAEASLGVRLPDGLKQVWAISNGLDYPQDWRVYPVFDKSMPKKCWGHIVEENKRSSYDYIQDDLLKVARDSYGNHLVLKVAHNVAGDTIYIWNHETTALRKSPITFEKIQTKAQKRIGGIMKKISRNMKKRKS